MNNIQGIQTVIYPVKDITQTKTLYATLLGVEPYMVEPYYVGFRVGDQDIGLDPNGHKQGLSATSTLATLRIVCNHCWTLAHKYIKSQRCGRGQADCIGKRRRWEHHRSSSVTLTVAV